MRRFLAGAVLMLTIGAVSGCDKKSLCVRPPADPGTVDPGGVDNGSMSDAITTDIVDLEGAPTEVFQGETVVPAAYIPPASFRFQGAGREGDAFRVEVVARDVKAVFGIALRVEWDPAALSLVSVVPAPILGDEGAGEAVYKAAEVRPVSLAIGLAHLYYEANTALDGDVVVATLVLKSLDGRAANLSFYEPRCMLVDSTRTQIDVTYLPSVLVP